MPAIIKTKAQIGRCGELLVQYQLLKHGIESAPMTTDRGVDLVAFSPVRRRAFTIQVKTNLEAKRAGGHGKLALDWWLPEKGHADLAALVDLQEDRIWLFRYAELKKLAQQRPRGRLHFFFYTASNARPRRGGCLLPDYDSFRFQNRVDLIFRETSRGAGTVHNSQNGITRAHKL
jgi:hypothetical protein